VIVVKMHNSWKFY